MRALRSALISLARLVRDVRGATAVEYGLIAALIVVAMIASLKGMANQTSGMWNNVATAVRENTPR